MSESLHSPEEIDSHPRRSRVVVAHDYLTQRGGAERVALEIARAVNADEIVTSVYRAEQTFSGFRDFHVRQSWLGRAGIIGRDPRRALPLLPVAWRSLGTGDADLVICSSSGFAHGVRAKSEARKIVYCHNPARWLYQPEDYTRGMSAAAQLALRALTPALRSWDRRAAASADAYLANSTSVAARIRSAYGIEAEVLHPPVSIELDGALKLVDGLPGEFFLTVGRLRSYKATDRLLEAFDALPEHNLVVVGDAPTQTLPRNVHLTGRVSDDQLRWLYTEARALVSVSREDFGLTPIEANAFGTPALVLRAGGFLDSTVEGVSGEFIENETTESIRASIKSFPRLWDRDAIRRNAERFSASHFMDALLAFTSHPRDGHAHSNGIPGDHS